MTRGASSGCYRCKVVLAFSITFNMLLFYALCWATGNAANPVIISLGWLGLGVLVGSLVFSFVEEEEEEEEGE